MSDSQPSPSTQPTPPSPRVYRYFVVFEYANAAGQIGKGNAVIERQLPITEAGGPDGLQAMQTDVARQLGAQSAIIVSLTVLPHDKPAIVLASSMPNISLAR